MKTWTNIDKSEWGPGPWQDEPDKAQWIDKDTDLDCLIVRNPVGGLCGYVGVPPGHPWFEVDYSGKGIDWENFDESYEKTPEGRMSVHGGLTYADKCWEDADEGHGVCHVPEPGRTDNIWWFGFDCAHAFDLVPGMRAREREMGMERIKIPGEVYRDFGYVQEEVTSLAKQLAEVR